MHPKMVDLLTKQAEERARVEREILAIAPFSPWSGRYVAPEVYGQRVETWITFRESEYESLRDKNVSGPDSSLVHELLSAFRPLPVFRTKADGCTTVSPDIPHRHEGEPEPIGAVLCDANPAEHFHRVSLRWWAENPDGGKRLRLSVEWPIHAPAAPKFGDLSIDVLRSCRTGDVEEIRRCELSPPRGAQRIRWASGDRRTLNHFTVFFDSATRTADEWCAIWFGESQS